MKLKGTSKKTLMNKQVEIVKRFLSDPLRLRRYENELLTRRRSNTRLTYWVNGGYKNRTDRGEKLYWWMFGEDIHLRILPYGRDEAKVCLCPADTAAEERLKNELDDDGYSFSLQEVVEKFIRDATQIIYSYGEAYYEIERLNPENDTEPRFKLELIYTPSMKRFLGRYYQVIPPAAAKHASIRMGLNHIPANRLLHITSPTQLGGKKGLGRIMRGLLSHGGMPLPKFSMETLEAGNKIGFSVDEYGLNRYIYRAQLTKQFGWSQRRDTDAPILEYYWLTRLLRQARALVLIRSHIVEELNKSLSEFLDEGQKIHVQGPYTLKDIEEAENNLQKGDINVNELAKKFI